MSRKARFAIAAVLLISRAALADLDSLEDRILACAEKADDTRRLSCYDRQAGALSDTGEDVSPKTVAAPVEDVSPETVAAPAVVAETAAPPASTSAMVDAFGMTPELARSKPETEKEAELREISAIVVNVSRRPRGELVVTLDNGQTWTEKDAEHGFRVKVGDTVVIRKGARFGGYRMVGRGRRASAVRRIN